MGLQRIDNSIQSANNKPYTELSVTNTSKEFAILRCMVIRVLYVDDPENITKLSPNPQVTYDVIVMGGQDEGQIIDNVRVSNYLGGESNYAERIFKPASKERIDQVAPEKLDGDVVYVGFVGGDKSSPVILGGGTQSLDRNNTGATKADGPRFLQEYNGVLQLINKNGEFILTRKGGELDADSNTFKTGEGQEGKASTFFLDKNGSALLMSKDGSLLSLNSDTTEASLIHKDGHLLTMTEDEITLAHKDGAQVITIDDSKIQLTSEGDITEQSTTHTIDTGGFSATAAGAASIEGGVLGGKLNINLAGQVALGNSAAELLDLFNQTLIQLQLMNTLLSASLGNLGFPLLSGATPYPAAFTPILTSLTAIQAQLLLIKGTL